MTDEGSGMTKRVAGMIHHGSGMKKWISGTKKRNTEVTGLNEGIRKCLEWLTVNRTQI